MTAPFRYTLAGTLCLAAAFAIHAAEPAGTDGQPAPVLPSEPASDTAPAQPNRADSPPADPPPTPWKWEGAFGPIGTLSPEYAGSAGRRTSVTPGFYLRYGRISISNASGFVTRRNKDDVFRGLGLDVRQGEHLRLNVALRIDNGRKSEVSSALNGIDDVRRTIRANSSATYTLEHGWKVGITWGTDLLGRGSGNILNLGVGHDRRVGERTTWNLSSGLTMADRRNMQSYFGVTPAESAASGYPVYSPGAGLRDVSLGMGWRSELNDDWVALWGGSVGRVLGPAARSPLTTSTRSWTLTAGIARRF